MKVALVVVFALWALLSCSTDAATVSDAVGSSCSTATVAGLSQQLVRAVNCLRGGLFTNLNTLSRVQLSSAAAAVPYLQTAAASALQRAVNQRGATISINSGLRTLPQQLMLYTWYLRGRCNIRLAAKPGASNHNGGMAIDIEDAYSWKSALENNGWRKLGDSDPMHYDYLGSDNDIRSLSVMAFQRLWNVNNPSNQLTADGVYGPKTEAALMQSPTGGFGGDLC